MNCRDFERHTADRMSRRLSPERCREMAAHQADCPACARAALAEARLRAAWRESAPPAHTPDLWPRLARRLEAQGGADAGTPPGRRRGLRLGRRPHWAFATALALLTLGLCR